jgi:DNA modification methylase
MQKACGVAKEGAMKPYYKTGLGKLYHGSCEDVMKQLPENLIDFIITDPPYGLNFMGKKWDYDVPSVETFKIMLDAVKPGATMFCFAGSRTQHRMAVNIEDAGWILKDCIMYLYGSGFPKATDISKQMDKGKRVKELVPTKKSNLPEQAGDIVLGGTGMTDISKPVSKEAHFWDGWKSHGLKPAYEIIICAEKPLDNSNQKDIIIENLLKKEAQLWLLLSAPTVKKLINMEKNEQKLANIAHWNVCDITNIREDLCGQMDISQFESTVITCLNIVISWRQNLEELWKDTSMSTIKTETNQTIDWKTLNFLLSHNTLQSLIQAEMKQPGSQLSALPVAKILNVVKKNMNVIQELSVVETVISNQLIKPQDVAGKTLSLNAEPILVCMKPNEGSYAENALKHGVAGLNIDGGRIGAKEKQQFTGKKNGSINTFGDYHYEKADKPLPSGRYPANIILDKEAAEMLDEQSGELRSGALLKHHNQSESENNCMSGKNYKRNPNKDFNASKGGASRFFYCAKASKSERNAGLSGNKQKRDESRSHGQAGTDNPYNRGAQEVTNHHPTVKPLKLMKYLLTLLKTPTGGVCLDCFAGSGSALVACEKMGINYIGIEREKEYCEISKQRITRERQQTKMF